MATTTSHSFTTIFQSETRNFRFPGILYEPPNDHIIITLDGDDYNISNDPKDVFTIDGLVRTYNVTSHNRW